MNVHDQNKLRESLGGEEERKRRRKEMIRDALTGATIPVSDEVRDAVAALFVTDALEVLRAHPGFDLEDKIQSIRTTLQLFDQAFADLTAALDAFDAFSRRPEFGYRSHRDELTVLETRIRKEIFTYSELGHSLQDHCRRVRERWDHPGIACELSECFGDDGLHDFVCGLRRVLHHLLMVEANWLIRDSGPTATSHYVFSREELRAANPDWNVRAHGYLDSCGDEIDVGVVARDYHPRVHAFYDRLLGGAETAPPPEVADYRRCLIAHRQRDTRMGWRLLLTEFLKRDVDPYVYLERYLTQTELEGALRLPRHSREQADFIISAVDEFSACDDYIRALVYRLFGVVQETA
jgi:hypothetical protein